MSEEMKADCWNIDFSADGRSALIYSLRQEGWRKGEPVLVNDTEVRVLAAPRSETEIRPIAAAIYEALSRPAPDAGKAEPVAWGGHETLEQWLAAIEAAHGSHQGPEGQVVVGLSRRELKAIIEAALSHQTSARVEAGQRWADEAEAHGETFEKLRQAEARIATIEAERKADGEVVSALWQSVYEDSQRSGALISLGTIQLADQARQRLSAHQKGGE